MNLLERERAPENLIGRSPWAVIGEIWRANPRIDTVYFSAIKPWHNLERQDGNQDPLLHNPAVAYGQWSKSRSLGILDQTLVGRRVYLELLLEFGALPFLKAEEGNLPIKFEEIKELVEEEREKFILSAMSVVKMEDGSFAHIPMIDFSSSGVGHDLSKAKEGLGKIRQKRGFLLNSGNGLHYYGLNLLSKDEWPQFLGRCLLLNMRETRIVDHRFIGHRLIDGYSCLRVTAHSTKPTAPTVVDFFEDASPCEPTQGSDFLRKEKAWGKRLRSGKPLFEF